MNSLIYTEKLFFVINKYIKTFENYNDSNSNFKIWFSQSKLVDTDGEPLIVYHGTNIRFNIFDINKKRSGWLSNGFYFTVSKEEAEHYGNIVIPVYLRIINPFIIESDIINPDGSVTFGKNIKEQIYDKYPETRNIHWKEVANYLQDKGYDGVINSNNLIVIFHPNQVKAVENDGSWDLNNNDIYS